MAGLRRVPRGVRTGDVRLVRNERIQLREAGGCTDLRADAVQQVQEGNPFGGRRLFDERGRLFLFGVRQSRICQEAVMACGPCNVRAVTLADTWAKIEKKRK